jgi:aspartyl-tRNA(Asn)/glutamyl-tRNA(Gln) amidotransferase subunit A
LEIGRAYSSTEYILARRTQATLRRAFEQVFNGYDVLMLPTAPIPAPPIRGKDALEQARVLTRFTAPFNLTGLPAISIPCGFTDQGLPVGLQLVAAPWAEATLLRAAYAYEQGADWQPRRPRLPTD